MHPDNPPGILGRANDLKDEAVYLQHRIAIRFLEENQFVAGAQVVAESTRDVELGFGHDRDDFLPLLPLQQGPLRWLGGQAEKRYDNPSEQKTDAVKHDPEPPSPNNPITSRPRRAQ